MTLHRLTPAYCDGHPDGHYALEPWIRPMRGEAIDPRYGCAGSEPAVLDVPEGSTVRETARGLAVTRPDGTVTYFTTRPPPARRRGRAGAVDPPGAGRGRHSARRSRSVMVKTFPFALGWRPTGSKKRRWQLQDCVDAAEAAAIAASLARLDGGGRWRVYDMVTVPGRAGSLVLVRRNVVAEGVVGPEVRRAGGTGSAGVDP